MPPMRFAPVATVGFTYDFNEKWFAVGSLSYAHLKNETTITVTDAKHGELIHSKADIEVNPDYCIRRFWDALLSTNHFDSFHFRLNLHDGYGRLILFCSSLIF